ncbi:MAG TPA: DUF4384 domain-containing protein [Candidatus Sulfopaludibacter sp.]|jgi:hypothetical protein|nr:DUF4384 domain-containing protein [Candidatus Sulfopaludibacter sp.]
MKTRPMIWVTIMVACFGAWAQQRAQQPAQPAKTPEKKDHMEGARELFYLAVAQKDALPPVHKTAQRTATAPVQSAAAIPPKENPGAVHLGLRYNLVVVDPQSGRSELSDPDRVLKRGECFALDFESNRSGYLYVLAKQSSGSWQALMPSAEMAEESNIIDPGKRIRVPKSYCFEIGDPAGSETLFVVLSRDPRDFYDLSDGIKRQNSAPAQAAPPPTSPVRRTVDYADASMDNAVKHMAQQFGTRDIAIRKVNQPLNDKEPPNSVYVVNTSDRPSSSVVTQIEVKHR